MTALRTPIQRAMGLAHRAGVRTQAKTLRGVLAAIKKAGRKPASSSRGTAARATPILSLAEARAQWAGFEGKARTDLIGDQGLLDLAVEAHGTPALRFERAGRCVPNSYKGAASASVAWAEARGRVVVLAYARTTARHASYGAGETPASAAGAPNIAIRREDLHAELMRRRAAALAETLDGRG